MTHTYETQEAPGSVFLARPLHFKTKSEGNYYLRRILKSQRPGGGATAQKAKRPRRPTTARRRSTRADSLIAVDANPLHSSGRTRRSFSA